MCPYLDVLPCLGSCGDSAVHLASVLLGEDSSEERLDNITFGCDAEEALHWLLLSIVDELVRRVNVRQVVLVREPSALVAGCAL